MDDFCNGGDKYIGYRFKDGVALAVGDVDGAMVVVSGCRCPSFIGDVVVVVVMMVEQSHTLKTETVKQKRKKNRI